MTNSVIDEAEAAWARDYPMESNSFRPLRGMLFREDELMRSAYLTGFAAGLAAQRCVFVDMDGVLADFDSGYEKHFGRRPHHDERDVKWEQIRQIPFFFRRLEPMADAFALWQGVFAYKPVVLTGVPDSVPHAADEKREWIAEKFGADVQVICCRSRLKFEYGRPDDVLIDDRAKCGEPWTKMGGVWINHRSAADSLCQLQALPAFARPVVL